MFRSVRQWHIIRIHSDRDLPISSSSCRQRDSSHSSSAKSPMTSPSNPTFRVTSPQDIIPQRSPTSTKHVAFFHPGKSSVDSDSESIDSDNERRPPAYRSDSEAARYLQKFSSSAPRHSSRPRHGRSSTNVPSLTHSLTSSSSNSVPYSPPSEQGGSSSVHERHRFHADGKGSKSPDHDSHGSYFAAGPASLETIKNTDSSSQTPKIHGTENHESLDRDFEKRQSLPSKIASPGESSLRRLLGRTKIAD